MPDTPKWILRLLEAPAPEGQRHHQALDLAGLLLRYKWTPQEVFSQLRSMYDQGVTDAELVDIVCWREAHHSADAKDYVPNRYPANAGLIRLKPKPRTDTERIANARKFCGSELVAPEDLFEVSPIGLQPDWKDDSVEFLRWLYRPDEWLNINWDFLRIQTRKGEKLVPRGSGMTKQASTWIQWLADNPLPAQEAGIWIRMNPLNGPWGSGKEFAHTDADVASCRFILLESDCLSPELQLTIMTKLPVPIALIVSSGRRGYHAWVMSSSKTEDQYTKFVDSLFAVCYPLGFDRANRNPSRFSRFPGAVRLLDSQQAQPGEPFPFFAQQKLVYVNATPRAQPIF